MATPIKQPVKNAGKSTPSKKVEEVVEEEEFDFSTMTGAEWTAQYGYSIIANTVSANKNGYPYITFLHKTEKTDNGKSAATNIYFSKSASELVSEGDEVTAELMSNFQFCYVTCESAEEGFAWKLCGKGSGGNYQDASNVF